LHGERRSRTAECDGSEPSLLVRADSAFSRRSEGPTPCYEALPQRERPTKEANPLDSKASLKACPSEPTIQMMQGPKGRRSAMKPSPTGKADEGGQSLSRLHGEPTMQMMQGPKGRQSAIALPQRERPIGGPFLAFVNGTLAARMTQSLNHRNVKNRPHAGQPSWHPHATAIFDRP